MKKYVISVLLSIFIIATFSKSVLAQTNTFMNPGHADAKIDRIYGDRCFCVSFLSAMGHLFGMEHINVRIVNTKCPKARIRSKISGKVVVEYYDHAGRRTVKQERRFSNVLNYKTLRFEGKVLTKVLKATIYLSSNVRDCNLSNNSKTINSCVLDTVD